MLNLKKEADVLEVGELKIATCPICSAYVCHTYFMQDAKTKKQSKWFACSCGVVFQSKLPEGLYDAAYRKKYALFDKKTKSAYEYPVRIYAPIIEERIYGRKVLVVGCPTPHQAEAFAARGWIDYSIDKNSSYEPSERFFVGDFENYQFPEKYNMLWIYQTLECFADPIRALLKCKELLAEDGILFIGTPDTDFIHTRSSSNFVHWKPDMNYLMWNRRSLIKHLEKLGFNIILAVQNHERRFPAFDDIHLIAQVKFF